MAIQLFQLLPWEGGVNSAKEESLIPHQQCTIVDNVVFDTRASRKKREGLNFDWDAGAGGARRIIGIYDFWYGSTPKTQKKVAFGDDGTLWHITGSGAPTQITDSGTAYATTITRVSFATFNNKLIVAVDGLNNKVKYWDGTADLLDLPGTPPTGSILREHLGRLWMNDKTNPERLHYSPVADHTKWNGTGDSGAFNIGSGDGDPVGINGISHTFQGTLFVGKQSKLYKLQGAHPELMTVVKVSDSIGVESHNSFCMADGGDQFFVSYKGVHSLSTTSAYGDFQDAFVSVDIQRTFNETFDRSRLKYVHGLYLPDINSIMFTFTETTSIGRTYTVIQYNNAPWFYNIAKKAWFRWFDIPCSAASVIADADRRRIYFGGHNGRVISSFTGNVYDLDYDGVTQVAIKYRVKTGIIYADNNSYTMKAFKRFALYYKPTGIHTLSINFYIDNTPLAPENQLSFELTDEGDLLGATFTLGISILGFDTVLAPYSQVVEGVGRGFKVELSQNGIDEEIEIQGFTVEYEPAGLVSEVVI